MIKYFLIIITFIKTNLHSQSDKINKIDSIICSKVEKDHPRLGVGIIKDGKIIYENAEVFQISNIKFLLMKKQDQT